MGLEALDLPPTRELVYEYPPVEAELRFAAAEAFVEVRGNF